MYLATMYFLQALKHKIIHSIDAPFLHGPPSAGGIGWLRFSSNQPYVLSFHSPIQTSSCVSAINHLVGVTTLQGGVLQ